MNIQKHKQQKRGVKKYETIYVCQNAASRLPKSSEVYRLHDIAG